MQRAASTLAGIAAVLLALWLVVRGFHAPRPGGYDSSAHAADADLDDGGGLLFALGDSGGPGSAGLEDDAGAGLPLLGDMPAVDMRVDGGPGSLLPDGSQVPPLPFTVPRVVRFGVVLVSYAGAQPSAGGGRAPTRSRADARALAAKLVATAKDDFHAAVQQGDAGSADDLGTIKLGLLEPAPEYVLFTLPVGGVGGPVDTPRGYWIVKRLE
jgi:hypothetical protein